MTISELLAETQYEGIVFYLTEHGYSSPLELTDFDFDELYFIPGVSDEAVEQCKGILSDYIYSQENDEEQLPQERALTKEEFEPQSNQDQTEADLSAVINNLSAQLSAAINAVGNRDRLDLLRQEFLSNSVCYAQYDYDLFAVLCDEIDSLISEPDETKEVGYSQDEIERLTAVTIQDIFTGVPRGGAMIRFCIENGLKTLLDLERVDFSVIQVKGLGPDSVKKFKKLYIDKRNAVLSGESLIPEPEKTAQEWFAESLSRIKDRDLECLLARAQGLTLQATGELYEITRERVRQITAKAVRRLRPPCEALFRTLADNKSCICISDIKDCFSEQNQIDVFAYVLKNIDSVRFFRFADKYVLSEAVPVDWDKRLQLIAKEIIGDSINYYDTLELIDERLSSEDLTFLDSIDYMGYLLENGYKALGDYVVRKAQAYRNVCLGVIRRHFQDGIKLDSDDNNEDMSRLRSIVHKEFGEAGLPDSNRALTARVTPALILCGRGRYISPENIVIDIPLIEQIVDYINENSETSLYYAEIYSAFSGRLLAQTDIDNANFLHGVLKYLFPDEFSYERDLLVKKGMERVPFEERLAQLIKDQHRPMAKAEIQDKLLGVTDIRIVNALVRMPEIIQWDYNEYNHIDNLNVCADDVRKLGRILHDLTEKQSGYCSENGFFGAVSMEMPVFIKENKIHNSHNLFYVANYLFRDRYRFSRPHIASDKFPNIELTNANVAKFFIQRSETLFYPDLVEMSKQAGWANGTFTLVLNAVEKDYCKISLNEYVLKSSFQIDDASLALIAHVVSDLVSASGYYGIFAVYNYDRFPSVPYEWNEFLLQTILEEYDLGFKVLEPNTKDRRYKRGIIVPDSCSCSSFEEFVIEQLKADSIQAIPEDEFSSYLRRKGLVLTTNIPQELFDGDGVRLEKGVFVYD